MRTIPNESSLDLWQEAKQNKKIYRIHVRHHLKHNKHKPLPSSDIARIIEFQNERPFANLLDQIVSDEVQYNSFYELSPEVCIKLIEFVRRRHDNLLSQIYQVALQIESFSPSLAEYLLRHLTIDVKDINQQEQIYTNILRSTSNFARQIGPENSLLQYLLYPHQNSSYWHETGATDDNHELFSLAVGHALQQSLLVVSSDIVKFIGFSTDRLENWPLLLEEKAISDSSILSSLNPQITKTLLEAVITISSKSKKPLFQAIVDNSQLDTNLVEQLLHNLTLFDFEWNEKVKLFRTLRKRCEGLQNVPILLTPKSTLLSDYWLYSDQQEVLFLLAMEIDQPLSPGSNDLKKLIQIAKSDRQQELGYKAADTLQRLNLSRNQSDWLSQYINNAITHDEVTLLVELCIWFDNQKYPISHILPIIQELANSIQIKERPRPKPKPSSRFQQPSQRKSFSYYATVIFIVIGLGIVILLIFAFILQYTGISNPTCLFAFPEWLREITNFLFGKC